MNETAWKDSGTGLDFASNVSNVAVSTAVVVGELYYKMVLGAFGGRWDRFRAAWNSNGGVFSHGQIAAALGSHRGYKDDVVNRMYGMAIQNCAFEMQMGRATRGYDWIYWYGKWEHSYTESHK